MSRSVPVEAIDRTLRGEPLDQIEAETLFSLILDGKVPDAGVITILTSLALRGEVANELIGAVRAVRSRMTPLRVPPALRPLLDTCGTGGDGASSFNVSTAVALVAASCGLRVAKHGNRSASGSSGSSEVLAELGVNIDGSESGVVRSLEELGIAFLYAPNYHPALRRLAPLRRQLAFRTIFNLIGPLANPASPEFQLIGVPTISVHSLYTQAWRSLAASDLSKVAIIWGRDGLDEVSISGETTVSRICAADPDPVVPAETWMPSDFGLVSTPREALRVSGPVESARRMREVLSGSVGPVRDIVLANTAAALLIAGRAESLLGGIELAAEAIDTGRAAALLGRWIALSRSCV